MPIDNTRGIDSAGAELVVVLDTSVVDDDPRMQSARMRLLLEGAPSAGARVVLPAVVVDELRRHAAERVSGLVSAIEASQAKLERLVGWDVFPKADPLRLKSLIEGVEHWFDESTNDVARTARPFSIAPHPTVSHKDLSQSAITRRKPFKKDGQGYQDALIWHTVLSVLADVPSATVVFISKNTNDFFADDKRTLHADLIADLEQHKCAGRVLAFTSLEEFNRVHVLPTLRSDARMRFDIERSDTTLGTAVRDWLLTQGPTLELWHLIGTAVEEELVDEATDQLTERPGIVSVKRVHARTARDLGASEIVFELNVACRVQFDIAFARRSHEYQDGRKGPMMTGELPPHVHHYLEDVEISMTMVLRKEPVAVVAADIGGVGGRHGEMEIEEEEEGAS